MALTLTAAGGRYPYALTAYRAEDIRATLEVRDETVRIRIDDVANPDRWEEFTIDRAALQRLLLTETSEPDQPANSFFDAGRGS